MAKRVYGVVCAAGAFTLVATVALAGQARPASGGGSDYNWTGVVVGGHVGASFSHTDSTTVDTVSGASEGSGSSSASHMNGGFQGGYDYMMPSRLVVGVLAAATVAGLNDTTTTTTGANSHSNTFKTDWAGSFVGEVGYAAGRALIYGTAGLGWSTGSATRTQVTGTTGTAGPGTVETLSVNQSGFTGGAGVAYGVGPHLRIFGDYKFSPRSHTNTFPLAQRSTSSSSKTNGIQFGVNFQF